MLKVLIIDDEPNVRRGLKTIINWTNYGYSVCGEAIDGIDALSKIEKLEPDLILADIKMPYMNGLELIQKVREKGIKCKVIILSGYSDFDYAKRAIQFGVSSYLLKPIEEKELIEIITELHDVIIREKGMEDIINSGKRVIKNEMLRALITGNVDDNSIEEDIREEFLNYKSFIIALEDLGGYKRNIRFNEIDNILAEETCVDAFEFKGYIILLFKGTEVWTINRVLKNLCCRLKKEWNCDSFTAVGRKVNSIREIKQSYEDALEILQNKFYYGHESLVFYDDISKRECEIKNKYLNDKFDLHKVIEKLYVAVETGDDKRITSLMDDMNLYFISNGLQEDRVKGICSTFIREILKRLYDNYGNLGEQFISDDLSHKVYKMNNWSELREYLMRIMKKISQHLLASSSDFVIKRILDYIEKNIDKDLKLEIIAEIFGYSSAYLGKMFKSYIGEYYNTYLDRVRIESSKKLLLQGVRTAEVAKRTGFKNTDYFYYKFKKYVGMGPSDFKKLNQ